MTWTTEAKIAAALARHLGIDCGLWAFGETAEPTWQHSICGRKGVRVEHAPRDATVYCRECIDVFVSLGSLPDGFMIPMNTEPATPVPVPDPLDVEAYLADCARRGVEPGPLPALSWEGEGVRWSVVRNAHDIGAIVTIQVGNAQLWNATYDDDGWSGTSDFASAEQWHRVAEMARVVEEALR